MLNVPIYQLHSTQYDAQGEKAYLTSFIKYMDFYDPNNFDEYVLP